jgi:glycosyltransferase involved in cell wall biosynthesis
VKILHIINDLRRGGAETALVRFAERSHDLGDSVSVICLKADGELADSLRSQGIPVTSIGLGFGPRLPLDLLRLIRAIRNERPDIVQTWLYHSNLLGGLASRVARPRTPVVWGIHHSILKQESSKRTTMLVSKASALLSRLIPSRIVYCANLSRRTHEAAGYVATKGEVIPNGISLDVFRPDPELRTRLRNDLEIDESSRVIGIVARNHPDKDIPTFVRAAADLAATNAGVRFVLVGKGLDNADPDLRQWIDATGYADRFLALGPRNDVPEILNMFDIATLSSVTEAFPISIIEAMAVGVPFVSTDVGDAREVIDVTGKVVPPSSPAALANAWRELLSLDANMFSALGVAARSRVEQRYRLERTTDLYRAVYRSLQ